jgi:hypothetical protein
MLGLELDGTWFRPLPEGLDPQGGTCTCKVPTRHPRFA